MITLKIENNTNSEFINELKEIIEFYNDDFDGTITCDLSKILDKKEKLTSAEVWKKYCKKAYKSREACDISDWSPNNSSEIGKLIKTNSILRSLTNSWYQNYERRESVNMIEILENMTYELSDEILENEMSITEILNAIDINEIKNEIFVKDFLETINVFYTRNPLFKYDW